jgi:hypothetical protein
MFLDSVGLSVGTSIMFITFKEKRYWNFLLGGLLFASTIGDILAWAGVFNDYSEVVKAVPAIVACCSWTLALFLWTFVSPGT